jgi:hypothetical protein
LIRLKDRITKEKKKKNLNREGEEGWRVPMRKIAGFTRERDPM